MSNFISPELQQYLDSNVSPEPDYLRIIREETVAEVHNPKMISGHYQGRLLALISKMVRPKLILEIGTYTGYSALCLAEGLTENGRLITIEKNTDLSERIKRNFSMTTLGQKISLHIGDAHEIIPSLNISPDLVFIDGDKRGYSSYYDLLIPVIPAGGCILVDNVLWSGKVLEESDDKKTLALQQFNQYVSQDERVEKIILPVRDGITLIRKR